jgi:hypothetical protein
MLALDVLLSSDGQRLLTEQAKCPMLRCRKKFSEAGSMVRHVLECPHFEEGEFVCWRCDKSERFPTTGDKTSCSWTRKSSLKGVKGMKDFIKRKCSGSKRPSSLSPANTLVPCSDSEANLLHYHPQPASSPPSHTHADGPTSPAPRKEYAEGLEVLPNGEGLEAVPKENVSDLEHVGTLDIASVQYPPAYTDIAPHAVSYCAPAVQPFHGISAPAAPQSRIDIAGYNGIMPFFATATRCREDHRRRNLRVLIPSNTDAAASTHGEYSEQTYLSSYAPRTSRGPSISHDAFIPPLFLGEGLTASPTDEVKQFEYPSPVAELPAPPAPQHHYSSSNSSLLVETRSGGDPVESKMMSDIHQHGRMPELSDDSRHSSFDDVGYAPNFQPPFPFGTSTETENVAAFAAAWFGRQQERAEAQASALYPTRRMDVAISPTKSPVSRKDSSETFVSNSSDGTLSASGVATPEDFQCAQCNWKPQGQPQNYRSYLRKHKQKHKPVKFPCSQCKKSYTRKDNLKKHQDVKHGGTHGHQRDGPSGTKRIAEDDETELSLERVNTKRSRRLTSINGIDDF